MAQPLVTAVVPAYNAECFLAEALHSIQAQQWLSTEIIVVDDGSSDATARIAQACPGVVYLHQPNRGPAAARNRGIQEANGDFIAFLDADDLWPPGKLAHSLQAFQQQPSLEALTGRTRFIGDTSERQQAVGSMVSVYLGAAVFRRSVFDSIGLLDESLQQGEDIDWFLRVCESGINIKVSEEVTLFYRRHANSMMAQHSSLAERFKLLRKTLARRRAMTPAQQALFSQLMA